MNQEIKRHQELQEVQWKVQEVFIIAFQRNYTAQRTIQVLKSMFDNIEEEELDRQFREKYKNGVVPNTSWCYEHDWE